MRPYLGVASALTGPESRECGGDVRIMPASDYTDVGGRAMPGAIAELRRYHSVRIIVGDSILNSLRISGRFPTDDEDYFLAEINQKHGISRDRSNANFVVLRLD